MGGDASAAIGRGSAHVHGASGGVRNAVHDAVDAAVAACPDDSRATIQQYFDTLTVSEAAALPQGIVEELAARVTALTGEAGADFLARVAALFRAATDECTDDAPEAALRAREELTKVTPPVTADDAAIAVAAALDAVGDDARETVAALFARAGEKLPAAELERAAHGVARCAEALDGDALLIKAGTCLTSAANGLGANATDVAADVSAA